jgi:hypothetical protein
MRPKINKFMVNDLLFPEPRAGYIAKWQKVFRPTLLSWASTFSDPYATNTQLEDMVVMEMWDMIYPDIDLDGEERRDTAQKVVYLVCLIMWYCVCNDTSIFRLGVCCTTGIPPSGRVR